MIFSQLAHFPIIFQVDENLLGRISSILKRNNISFKKVLLVSGKTYSKEVALSILEKNDWDHLMIDDNSDDTVGYLRNKCNEKEYRLMVAVGGGKVLDTVKRVAYLNHLNHISVPTIISNDGLISPIAVIENTTGNTESLPAQMPMGVFIDLNIIRKSPVKYLQAAAGDVLSNLSATNDWILAEKHRKVHINDISFQVSRSAAHSLIYFNKIDFQYKPFLRQIIQGQINSGLAMGLAGNSRPCSGSEHLISHAIDYMHISEDTLHGLQVASVSLFSLYLQHKLKPEHLAYARATNTPLHFTDLSEKIESNLGEIFDRSKEMRPGRYTVLDQYSKQKFIEAYDSFRIKTVEENPA